MTPKTELIRLSSEDMTQDKAITFYKREGIPFASAGDIYNASKTADKKVIATLREDMKKSWFVTSTRIIYHPDSLSAEIVYHYGDKETRKTIAVPVYDQTPLAEVSLPFLRALFDTKDSAQEIRKTLEKLGGREEIFVWTPSQEGRKDVPERAARFGPGSGGFLVVGGSRVGGSGRSRGVRRRSDAEEAQDIRQPKLEKVGCYELIGSGNGGFRFFGKDQPEKHQPKDGDVFIYNEGVLWKVER